MDELRKPKKLSLNNNTNFLIPWKNTALAAKMGDKGSVEGGPNDQTPLHRAILWDDLGKDCTFLYLNIRQWTAEDLNVIYPGHTFFMEDIGIK